MAVLIESEDELGCWLHADIMYIVTELLSVIFYLCVCRLQSCQTHWKQYNIMYVVTDCVEKVVRPCQTPCSECFWC